MALLARDLEPYRPHLVEVAAEFGLPLYVAGGRPLAGNPAVAALLNLLSLPAEGWPRRSLLDALACPYFDWSVADLDAEGVRDLEAAARAGHVIAGLGQWQEALERLAGSGEEGTEATEGAEAVDGAVEAAAEAVAEAVAEAGAERDAEGLPQPPTGERARRLWASLQAATGRLSPPAQGTLRQHVAFVEDLVGEDPKLASRFRTETEAADDSLRLVARAWEAGDTAQRDVAALRRFKDVLRGLVLAAEVLLDPDEPAPALEYADFYVELRGAVEGARYDLPLPPPGSAVLAAPLLYARGLSFAAVALLGLAEGQFPQREREDPLLTESDREALRAAGLPLELRLQGDEASLFYEAATRARRHLLLTRPYLAADGQAWEPSPYWDEVQRLVAAPAQRLRSQEPLPAAEIASPPEALLAAALAGAVDDTGLPGWERVLAAAEVVRGRAKSDPAGCPWDGALDAVAPELAERYSPRHVWSASRLETYATCPFQFFAGSVLGLEPRQPPAEGYDVRILGTMYHAILEETYRRALPEAEPEQLRALLPEVADQVFAGAPDEYGFRPTPLWERQRRELTAILAETLEGLIEATAGWQVVALEQAFGLKGRPCLDVSLDDGRRLRLRGFVDRLDRDGAGALQVIDYKAGSTAISPRDLEEGKRVQLPLYALAVRDALGLGEVGGGFYWHIGSARASSLRLESYLGGPEVAMRTALEHALTYVQAVRAGRFPPQPPAGGCPDFCPAAAFCWRYAPRSW